MQQLLLLLSHRTGRIGLLIGLAMGFVISIVGSIILEMRHLTDTPVLPLVNVAEKKEAALHVKR